MWTKSFWCCAGLVFWFKVKCFYVEAISTSRFNANIRTFEESSKNTNTTDIKTLQKQERAGYIGRPSSKDFDEQFKGLSDSDTSDSTNGREFAFYPHNDFTEHGLTGYYGGGYEETPAHDHLYHHQPYHEPHYVDHEPGHGHGHGYDHGHHYDKHHALTVKSFLLPIAGLALLGAAAALVTNPVLLQLGVVTGRRRKRSTILTKSPLHIENKSQMASLHLSNQPYGRSSDFKQKRWKRSTLIPQPPLSTPEYDSGTLQRSWTEGSSESPWDLERVLVKTGEKYNIARSRRGKRQR